MKKIISCLTALTLLLFMLTGCGEYVIVEIENVIERITMEITNELFSFEDEYLLKEEREEYEMNAGGYTVTTVTQVSPQLATAIGADFQDICGIWENEEFGALVINPDGSCGVFSDSKRLDDNYLWGEVETILRGEEAQDAMNMSEESRNNPPYNITENNYIITFAFHLQCENGELTEIDTTEEYFFVFNICPGESIVVSMTEDFADRFYHVSIKPIIPANLPTYE